MDNKYKYQRKYWDAHREELNAKRRAKHRKQVNARLTELLVDYEDGRTIAELQDKYKVGYRHER